MGWAGQASPAAASAEPLAAGAAARSARALKRHHAFSAFFIVSVRGRGEIQACGPLRGVSARRLLAEAAGGAPDGVRLRGAVGQRALRGRLQARQEAGGAELVAACVEANRLRGRESLRRCDAAARERARLFAEDGVAELAEERLVQVLRPADHAACSRLAPLAPLAGQPLALARRRAHAQRQRCRRLRWRVLALGSLACGCGLFHCRGLSVQHTEKLSG